ncbi:MAG TPA: glycosyltransferase family 4 protein [Methylibium sp.]|nr:glycosyltransferase family 4 protein [Methylibium sp.]
MKEPPPWQGEPQAGTLVHVVGRIDESVFSFLGPATTTLAEAGIAQCVVWIDDPRSAYLLPRFDPRVELQPVADAGGVLRRWRTFAEVVRRIVGERRVRGMHLHGLAPLLWTRRIARRAGPGVPVYFSPHATPGLGARSAWGLRPGWLLKGWLAATGQRAIVTMLEEAAALHRATRAPIQVVESAVPALYYGTPRREARHPLIVTGSRSDDRRAVELFVQLAVLLSGSHLKLSFNWIGRLGPESVAQLKAANVGYFEADDDGEIATRLAAGWLYLAPTDSATGFPVFVAAAMALGLPCVVLGSPEHSDLLRDGETGYLCRTELEVMQRIGRLIDEAALRRQIGQAGRHEAQRRFSPERFRDSLLAAYELPPAPRAALTHDEQTDEHLGGALDASALLRGPDSRAPRLATDEY